MSRTKLFILFAPSILLLAGFAFSQVSLNTGSIYGKVLGPEGKPLPNVSVLLEAGGMASKTAATGASGTFLFPALVPGNYSLTFSLSGFSEVKQEDVPVSTGQTVALQITLPEALEETLVISGESPVVDPKRTGTSTAFTQSYLTKIPNARDPWVILDQTPGIDVNQINVGGNYSGQQSIFTARGASFSSNLWSYDGMDISDPAASGATPAYWDFDSFEEIQITTGGADASIRTGGVVINFITKRGGNRWAGQASAYFDNDSLESNNVDADLLAQHFVSPNQISQLYEYGGDVGGPLLKDRAWIWGAYRYQSIANITPGVLVHDSLATNLNGTIAGQAPDLTELENVNLKFNVSYNTSNEGVYQYLFSSKDKFGRFFLQPNQLAADSTLDQTGSGNMFKAEHSWLPNSNWFLSAKFAYFPGSFHLHPKADGAQGQPVIRLNEDFFWEHGSFDYDTTRPQLDVTFDANYFLQNKLGGDHEFKFGFAYKHASVTSLFQYGGDVLLYDFAGQRGDTSAGFGLARIQYDITAPYALTSAGFYAADTWRWKHLTLNLGFRFDTSTATSAPSVSSANSVAPDLLPEMRFPGTDPNVRYNTFAPRVGATWDITGSGKNIVRGNYARFYDNVSVDTVLFTNPLAGYTGVYVYYYDANGDGTITRDELLDNYYGIYGSIGFIVPGDADATVARFPDHRFLEPGLQPEQTQEFLIGFERGIKQNISVAATFTHRKYDHLQDIYIPDITSADFLCSPLTVQNPVTGETF